MGPGLPPHQPVALHQPAPLLAPAPPVHREPVPQPSNQRVVDIERENFKYTSIASYFSKLWKTRHTSSYFSGGRSSISERSIGKKAHPIPRTSCRSAAVESAWTKIG